MKKDEDLIKEQNNILIYGQEEDAAKRKKSIPGLVRNGVPLESAKKLADLIVEFSKYSFNRSHSACYAVLTMITGWLKCYYPVEFLAPLISSYMGKDDDNIVQYIMEARKLGIKTLPPDINKSKYEFTIEDNNIRYGLGAIKGLNKSAVVIIKNRESEGEYKDLSDFMSRFDKKTINKKVIDSLVLSGALDSISESKDRKGTLEEVYKLRGMVADSAQEILDKYIEETAEGEAKQMYSKSFKDKDLIDMEMLQIEKSLLGLYLSYHPLEGKTNPIDWDRLVQGSILDITCIIKKKRIIKTKKGDDMAYLTVETLEGDRDITVFPSLYESCKSKLDEGGIRVITINCTRAYRDPTKLEYVAKNIKYFRGDSGNV